MKKVMIDPGICGLITTAEAVSEDGITVNVAIQSACKGVMQMANELAGGIDAFSACLKKSGDGIVYDAARKYCPHAACPVPSGIIKCIEVECALALPKDASIKFISE